jgi:hypothetical protein
VTASTLGRERPPVVPPGSVGTGSAHADDHAAVYFPYFDMDMVFDDSRARALLGPAGIRCPHFDEYFPHLIEYAQSTRWGKNPLTREEAQAARAATAYRWFEVPPRRAPHITRCPECRMRAG